VLPERDAVPSRLERIGLYAGLVLAGALMWPIRGYLTDDTFIHLQYARNLSQGHGLVFNVGERVYGSTSPLWSSLIAAGMTLGLDGLTVARVMGAACTLLSVALFHRLMRRTIATPALVALGTLTWAGHAWMARWSVSGMETPLAVALTLGGFVAAVGDGRGRARFVAAGVLWALGALARPEAALLLALAAAWHVVAVARGRAPRVALLATLPGLAIYGAWLLVAWRYFGAAWPETLSAKTAGGGGLAAWAVSLGRQGAIAGATDGVLGLVLVAGLLFTRRVEPPHPARLLAWSWVVLLPALYAFRGVQVLSRYLLVILPVLEWLAWQVAERWWLGGAGDAERRRAIRWSTAVAALALIQNLGVHRFAVMPQVTSFTAGLERSLIPWGTWFSSHAPVDASIATPDIGAIGYFSRRRVLDLGGLVTPPMIPLLEREPLEEMVAELRFASFARPLFVVDRGARPLDLKHRSRYGACLEPLGAASVPNLGIARPGRVVYTFYRVNWEKYERITSVR